MKIFGANFFLSSSFPAALIADVKVGVKHINQVSVIAEIHCIWIYRLTICQEGFEYKIRPKIFCTKLILPDQKYSNPYSNGGILLA